MPGLRKLIDTAIVDAFSKILVLPNKLVIPILSDFNNNELDDFKTMEPKVCLYFINKKKNIFFYVWIKF